MYSRYHHWNTQNAFLPNRFRSTDVKIEVYDSVEFAVNVTDTNADYDLMDAATFGTKVYEVDHIALNAIPNIVIPLLPSDEDAPVQVRCPYKYAFSCEDELDERFCQNSEGYESWKALYAEYDTVDNSVLEWFCFNDSHLTDDLLNYKMKYTQSEADYDIYFYADISVEAVLDQCVESYIVDEVEYNCSVNGEMMDEIEDLSAGDVVVCELKMFNENGNETVFDNLQWSTAIMAKEVNFTYFPVKSVTVIDEENGMVLTNFTMPNCRGTWDVALTVDQTPIGGDVFVLWSLEDVSLSEDDEREKTGCNGLDGWVFADLIDVDGFEVKFAAFTAFTESMMNLSFVTTTTYSPTASPSREPTTGSPTTEPITTTTTTTTTSSPTTDPLTSETTSSTSSLLVTDIFILNDTETDPDEGDSGFSLKASWTSIAIIAMIFVTV